MTNLILLTTSAPDAAILGVGDNGSGYYIYDFRPKTTAKLPRSRKEPSMAPYLASGFCPRVHETMDLDESQAYVVYMRTIERHFGYRNTGLSANPIEWIGARLIARRAIKRGFAVQWNRKGNPRVDTTKKGPVIYLNWFTSRTAAIEEYLHATIIQRELDRGLSLGQINNGKHALEEELRLKSRLLGGLISGLHRDSLQVTYLDYLDRYINLPK